MILVVMLHLMGNTKHGVMLDVFINLSTVFTMPLMFFVSGYLIYKSNYSMKLFRLGGRTRIISQLYPTLLIGAVSSYIFVQTGWADSSFIDFMHVIDAPFKNGYWFTIALVEMFFIVTPLLYLFSKYEVRRYKRAISLLMCIIVASACYLNINFGAITVGHISGLTCMLLVMRNIPFFILGMIAKIYDKEFNRIITNKVIVSLSILIVLFSILINPAILWGHAHGQPLSILCSMSGIMVVFYTIQKLEKLSFSHVQKVLMGLRIIGKTSLEIYLLHYIFVYFVRYEMGLDRWTTPLDVFIEFPFSILVSIAIVIACLATVKLLKLTGLYMFVFPKKEEVARLGALLKFSKPAEN